MIAGTRLFLLLLALVGAASCGPSAEGSTSAQEAGAVTVFEGARLIVGDGSPPIEGSAFVVQGRTILAVGRAGELEIPAGAARVDLSGKTVMPAIVDPHSHIGYYDEVTDTEIQDDFTLERVLDHLDRFAYTGHALTYSMGSDTPEF